MSQSSPSRRRAAALPSIAPSLVSLAADHPGFRDPVYRARREEIARRAVAWMPGDELPTIEYTASEEATWRTVRERLEPLHANSVCRRLLELADRVALPLDRIPQLSEVSLRLERLNGFRFEPVAGLVEGRAFLRQLERGVFLSTQYVRHASRPLYTPEPDVLHELVGHAASLAGAPFADLSRSFGRAARLARDAEAARRVDRLYWATLEFGLVRERGEVRACGAGLLSSPGELAAIEDAEWRPLDGPRAARHPYDPTQFQEVLFVADGLDGLVREVERGLAWILEEAGPRGAGAEGEGPRS